MALLALIGATAPIAPPASAQAVVHEVTWAHPAPARVARFVVYVSPVRGSEADARTIDVGKPASSRTLGGAYTYFSAIVEGTSDEFVAVAAIGHDGSRTPLSAWSGLRPTSPGQPLLIGP